MLKPNLYQINLVKLLLILCFLGPFHKNSLAKKIQFTPQEKEWIKNHPVIYHGYEPNWPPYEMYEDGLYKLTQLGI